MIVEIKFKIDIEAEEGEGLGSIIERAVKIYPIPEKDIIYASIMGDHGGAIMGFS